MVTLEFNISSQRFDQLADLKESHGCISKRIDDMTFNEYARYLLEHMIDELIHNGK